MKFSCAILCASLCLLLATPATQAGVIVLKPGSSVMVSFDDIRLHEKGTPPIVLSGVGALANLSLDESGTILTVTLQNVSLLNTGAALYALDLDLPKKLVNQTHVTATFSNFPGETNWLGPTDQAALGSFVFAARAAVLKRLDDFLSMQTQLPAGFLQPGQQGKITITIQLPPDARGPLRLTPALYFLIPNPQSSQGTRLSLVVAGNELVK
jgi:hypothetical protein